MYVDLTRAIEGSVDLDYRLIDESGRGIRVSHVEPAAADVSVQSFDGTVLLDAGEPVEGTAIFVIAFPVPSQRCDEFDEWFAQEHAPLLLSDPRWRRARLLALENSTFSRLIVHDLDDVEVLESEHRRRAGQTARTASTLSGDWTAAAARFIGVRTQA